MHNKLICFGYRTIVGTRIIPYTINLHRKKQTVEAIGMGYQLQIQL